MVGDWGRVGEILCDPCSHRWIRVEVVDTFKGVIIRGHAVADPLVCGECSEGL